MLDEIRERCAEVAARARHVHVRVERISAYSQALGPGRPLQVDAEVVPLGANREQLAGFVLALDAINFGSGWFPTLRKRFGRSGYFTVALGLRERFDVEPERFSAAALAAVDRLWLAEALGQDSAHELMGHYAAALHELGERVVADHGDCYATLIDAASGSAEALTEILAGWPAFHDVARHRGRAVPFFKRAQIAAADLAAAGVLEAPDLGRLTLFADNLVPHVLRLDGVLDYAPALLARIEAGELLEHGSAEEVEIRACALHAVELIVTDHAGELTAAQIDGTLWRRGGGGRYKAAPRHRTRCTAY
ncbi:MAG: hypothetical protein DLM63_00900 [Solirubrobacterales bacterium]|nr:MAG: hypothetical protein DLM63_00900 [Solirubrobacterales bacterium]